MDDGYKVAIGAMVLVLVALVMDWQSNSFEVPGGIWGFLSALMAVIAARIRYKKDEDEK